jgi:hypothetical protein
MCGFSSSFEIFQLCRLRLIFRRVGFGFGGYRDASLARVLVRASQDCFGNLPAVESHGAERQQILTYGKMSSNSAIGIISHLSGVKIGW